MIKQLLLTLLLTAPFLSAEDPAPAKPLNSLPFAWPFLEPEAMSYRGGNTQGSDVTLDTKPSKEWQALQKYGDTPYQDDHRAILAMAGSYRVSFQFVETMGFTENYTPPQPYFSWGTEEVRVLEDRDKFISLQHTLVMFFKTEEGKVEGPMIVKHWRQDWTFEDTDLHTFSGDRTWGRQTFDKKDIAETWTQAVYQVDDSPRYEVVGKWNHHGGVSTWTSREFWRPLPRREFSVRDDYNILAGTNQLTITPTGWVHTQNNRKLAAHGDLGPLVVGAETGINRYERITAPDLKTGADEYWAKTSEYWKEVRKAWAEIYTKQDHFHLQAKVDGKKLYQHHFGYAAELEKAEEHDAEAGRKHAHATIDNFLKK